MNLKSGRLLWPERDKKFSAPTTLTNDVRCDVAIIGAGVTGALAAWVLSAEGVDTVLVDKRGIAQGSTSASTALIQYEIDVPLWRLIQLRGWDAAVRSYCLCREAIDRIAEVASRLGPDCQFVRRPSLYLARRNADAASMRREHRTRCRCGFDVEYLDRKAIQDGFGFSAAAALWSRDGAEIDPYRLTQLAIADGMARGSLRMFAPTAVRQIDQTRDAVTLRMNGGQRVVAKRLIVAAGYESTEFLRCKLIRLRSTYVLTTQPVAHLDAWPDRCLIWDSGRPYFYLRTTTDQRVMIGGADEDFKSAAERDAMIGEKAGVLGARLRELFPWMKVRPAYAWAGTFGETKDGLPYIGTSASGRRVLFDLCYGANGTNFAIMGAQLARDWVHQKRNRDARLFALER